MKNNVLKIVIILIVISITNLILLGQSLSVYEIDTSSFPTMKAKFFAFDVTGNQILNVSQSDFVLKENGLLRNVTLVSCPVPKAPLPISSVLTIDVSGSMTGPGIQYAKEAAKAWVQALPLGQSECAITTFNSQNYFNQDFTTNRNRLLNRIEELTTSDGTDFNAAFIDPVSGGLLAVEKGRYKKVMILLTDGFSTGNESAIMQKAKQIGATVFCISISPECPLLLRNIAIKTNGLWFENITGADQAREVYLKILKIVQENNPCSIEWESETNCKSLLIHSEITLLQNGITSNFVYSLPYTGIASLDIKPESIKFLNAVPGIKRDTIIKVTALNDDFSVTNITLSDPAFTVSPLSFNLIKGQSIDLVVSFIPADSAYIFSKIYFENTKCQKFFYAGGGCPGYRAKVQTLKLIQPNGSEVFVVGTDTTITWDGILPDERVKIEYSTDNGTKWITITNTATGFKYNWRIPKTPSGQCIARVTAKASFPEYEHNMILIPSGSFVMGNTGAFKGAGESDELPQHNITISKDFLMGKYEVTQKLYFEVMDDNPSTFRGNNMPVNYVSWFEAIEFCNRLSIMEGFDTCYSGSGNNIVFDPGKNGYRLPTEAEWEYACKAGSVTDYYLSELAYPECMPLDINLDMAGWYCGNSGNTTHDVGQKDMNSYGLYDIHGNVYEWCWDWKSDKYEFVPDKDPTGPPSGLRRVLRSGSFYGNAKIL